MPQLFNIIYQPWPWYVAGPLIGLIVPLLLLTGNKPLGISSSLKHICAACLPANIEFLRYDWRKETWSIALVIGVGIGGFIAGSTLSDPYQIDLSQASLETLSAKGIHGFTGFVPAEIFNWESLFTGKGFIIIVIGGFLVGFGTRYANGCTSGHTIMGLSNLQWPSLIATMAFFIGGLVMTHLILPYILKL